jgi:glutamate racemase
VIATTATFQGELFASVVERFAQNVNVLHQPCPGLVQQIEEGKLDAPETETMLRGWLQPMVEQGIDALVLGCTHYPFVRPLLQKIVGPGVRIIDPAPAVARRVKSLLEERKLLAPEGQKGKVTYYTSGDTEKFEKVLAVLTGKKSSEEVCGATWLSIFALKDSAVKFRSGPRDYSWPADRKLLEREGLNRVSEFSEPLFKSSVGKEE